jgi:hypothetical protein
MAFVLGTPVSDDGEERRVAVDQYAFQVVQDGRPRVVRFAADSLHLFRNEFLAYSDSFPVWELTIPPRAMSTVEMRYFADWDAGCDGGCFQFFRYYARPAALWAGRLERASFRLHLGDDTFVRRLLRPRAPWSASVTPGGFQWTKDGVSWGFEDWKPDSDLVVRVDYAGGDDFCESEPSWNPWTPDSKAAAPAITSGLDRVPEVESRECPDEGDCPWLPTEEWGTWQFHLRAHVTVAGQVDQVRCPEPPSMMAEDRGWGGRGAAAMQCVRRWRFRPAMRAGRIVDAWVDVRLESASHE